MNTRNKIIAIVAAVVALILVVAGGLYLARPKDKPEAAPTPSASASAPASSTAPSPSPSKKLTCTTTTDGFVPVRYTFSGALKADEKVLSLGQDEEGNIAAPPPAEKRTAAWWNEGPKPGAPGKTVLSIHTYRNGKALGNEMYKHDTSQMKPGDEIKLYGENGEVACYKFTEAKKVMVDEYDPDSDMMVDFDGDSEVAIIICWDFDGKLEEQGKDPWQSRVFFYGELF